MKNKAGFYSAVSGYLKKGIAVPVYASDKLAVMRIADSFYIASDYTEGKNGYVCLLVNSKMIRAMMVDENYLEQLIVSSDRQMLAAMMFELDGSTFKNFRTGSKGNLVSDLQHRFVDDKMEQWIFDTFGKPEIEIPSSGRKVLNSLFKRN